MTPFPVYPETPVPQDRKEILEMQDSGDSQVLQGSLDSLDPMDLKGKKDSLDFLGLLEDKARQVLLEELEKKDLKATATLENQALQDYQALLD